MKVEDMQKIVQMCEENPLIQTLVDSMSPAQIEDYIKFCHAIDEVKEARGLSEDEAVILVASEWDFPQE